MHVNSVCARPSHALEGGKKVVVLMYGATQPFQLCVCVFLTCNTLTSENILAGAHYLGQGEGLGQGLGNTFCL